jgi:hypothetical protein
VDHHLAHVVARVLDERFQVATRGVEEDQPGRVGAARVEKVHPLVVLGEAHRTAREGVLLAPGDRVAPFGVFVFAQE